MKSTPMPRGTSELSRRTPLSRSSPSRRTPMERGEGLRRVGFIRRRSLPIDPVWTAVRKVVWERCGGRDEFSGEPLDPDTWQCHHRRFRSRGGQHSACNAVALTPARHGWVHRAGQIVAKARGFVVASTEDPAAVPVLLHDGRLVWLTPSGAYAPVLTTEEST